MKKVLFILGQLTDADVEWLIGTGKREKVRAGTVLIHEGKPIDALYFVLDGAFSVTVAALKNREVARLGAGEVLGEMSYVDARPPSATVTAVDESLVLAIDRAGLLRKLERDVGFAARFYKAVAMFLSDRLRATVACLGYEAGAPLKDDVEYEDELDFNVLDNVSMAGLRFEQILRRLRGG